MRVFISSVRRGLEVERDALPGLIRAVGHEPVRFEDLGAQPEPSREACLRGVENSDAYLLLLGPHYGHRFPETGQSPTHDEWVAATTRGMPRMVLRKSSVELEPDQEEFARLVGDYASGVFYAEFADTAELLTKAAEAVRRLAEAPSPLTYKALGQVPPMAWTDEWDGSMSRGGWSTSPRDRGRLELHAIPLAPVARSSREMREMPGRLVAGLRSGGFLPIEAGADITASTPQAAVVELPSEQLRTRSLHPSELAGVRLAASGQLSVWSSLPGDQLGVIFDIDDVTATLTRHLRLIGMLNVLPGEEFALAVGLGGSLTMLAEGRVGGVPRGSSYGLSMSEDPVRVPPDESVSAAAFDQGAPEVARVLAEGIGERLKVRR